MQERGPWANALLDWYWRHARDLPWRRTNDPYAIWVSEVMLQQTQVTTVVPYFERWMARFPSVEALAAASEDDVLTLWQGLGYYRRAKLLRAGAQWIVSHGVPSTLEGWREVPGIGVYTAAAVGSIAQGLPGAVVDGNVERVFARFTACPESGAGLLKRARSWADASLNRSRPGDWNQALMELGATVCTPRTPKCDACPISEFCLARQTWSVERFPVPKKAPKTVRLRHVVWVPWHEGRVGLRRIEDGEWWAGMWEFPRAADLLGASAEEQLRGWLGEGWTEDLGRFVHQVTHHRIEVVASLIRVEEKVAGLDWHSPEELGGLALPSPQRRILRFLRQAFGNEWVCTSKVE